MSIEFSRRSLLGVGIGAGIAATIGVPAAQAALVKDYVYQRQLRNYWCSAAAARIALSYELRYVQGRALPTQESLARGLDLEPNGAPSTAGLKQAERIALVLNNRIGTKQKGLYKFRQPNDLAPTLRKHVRHSINADFPVVVNVTRVDNDYYTAGHYIAIVGYGDESYKIADPANPNRNGVWRPKSTVVSWVKWNRYTAFDPS